MAKPVLLDGRFELLGPLGQGGEAEVYRARDTWSGVEVAVRVPRPGHGVAFTAENPPPRFHHGWVRLLSTGHDPWRGPYQVLELLRGESLRQIVGRGPLDPAAWRAFATESLAAVAALHAMERIHGDLNAGNFLWLSAPPRAWKLLELPFLRFAPAARRSALFGSIHTLAPEQFEGHEPGLATDVYALGCLYYYGATGEYPHGGGSSAEIAVARLRFPPVPLREKASGWPEPLAAWTMALLAREPQNRPDATMAARQLLAIA